MAHFAVPVRVMRVLGGLWIVGAAYQFAGCGDSPPAPAPLAPPVVEADAGNVEPAPVAPVDAGSAPTIPDPPPPPAEVDAGPSGCTPGETRACTFELLCTGTATCNEDGQTFGGCDCGSPASAIIGARCESDADCAGGAHCMTATGTEFRGAGGPAGGYCTFSCANTEECTQHDPDSLCSDIGPDGALFCVRTCLSKDAEPGEGKCLNRTDVVCRSVVAAGLEPLGVERQLGFCAPRCGSDEDCPAGRQCHRQGGVCTDFASPGLPVGSPCSLTTECDGQACEDLENGVGTCTAPCVLGALSGCGYGLDPESRNAACVTPAVQAGRFGEGPGDTGLCLALCDADPDCQAVNANSVCRNLNPDLAAFFGRAGACARGASE